MPKPNQPPTWNWRGVKNLEDVSIKSGTVKAWSIPEAIDKIREEYGIFFAFHIVIADTKQVDRAHRKFASDQVSFRRNQLAWRSKHKA